VFDPREDEKDGFRKECIIFETAELVRRSSWRRWMANTFHMRLDSQFMVNAESENLQPCVLEARDLFTDSINILKVFRTSQKPRLMTFVFGLTGWDVARSTRYYPELYTRMGQCESKLPQRMYRRANGEYNLDAQRAALDFALRYYADDGTKEFRDRRILGDTALLFSQMQYINACIEAVAAPRSGSNIPFRHKVHEKTLRSTGDLSRSAQFHVLSKSSSHTTATSM